MPDNLLVNKKLVRFRGMIQDMFSPVYYMQQYEVVNVNSSESSVRSGKFQDSLLCTVSRIFAYLFFFMLMIHFCRGFLLESKKAISVLLSRKLATLPLLKWNRWWNTQTANLVCVVRKSLFLFPFYENKSTLFLDVFLCFSFDILWKFEILQRLVCFCLIAKLKKKLILISFSR